ncbi:MAG TPA: UDP-N-acetylmuramoyl-tripeptide--D-alanyl-D-alanine ligase [Longimicrobiaceae bacterium]|nr:UDP-N-acetylmuramoyl-tripeptide--D-alanyl-D-alanine ligase [Longimicrobiaceae bacterium]
MSGFRWTLEEVERALEIPASAGAGEVAFTAVSTDTRKIEPGSLFVALQGASFDAHDFLGAAAEAGAAAAVVSRVPAGAPAGLRCVVVDDTLRALGRLGRHRRRALAGRVVAVAGSNGKTTTKELLRAALSPRLRVHATAANLNNQVGVPLTLLAAPDDAEAAVVEVGTNEPGEIALLAAIVEPDAVIVTSIGEEHLEGLGSLAGVLEEELSVLEGLRPGGVAFVAEDPPELPDRAQQVVGGMRLRVAGFSAGADLRPEGGEAGVRVRPDGSTGWRWEGVEVHVPLPGLHNARNALLALGVAREWGVPPAEAARGIAAMPPTKLRSEWRRVGTLGVLADCYNANPPSVLAAVDVLAALPAAGEKVAVLGTMRELGGHAEALHRSVAEEVARRVGSGIDRVVATGDFVAAFAPLAGALGERLIVEEDPLRAYEALAPVLRGDETVLLKGSRGVALERLIPLLERDFAAPAAGHVHAGG